MASQRNPGADGTARGASEFVQAALLNDPEDKSTPESYQAITGLDPARWPILARHWSFDDPRQVA